MGQQKGRLVPDAGFEPATFGLQNRCTTTVLIRQPALSLSAVAVGVNAKRDHLHCGEPGEPAQWLP